MKSKLTAEIKHVFEKFDYLISPTVPIQPFKFGEKINDPVSFMMVDFKYGYRQSYWNSSNISTIQNYKPDYLLEFKIMANHEEEHSLLQAAYALEKTVDLPEVPA